MPRRRPRTAQSEEPILINEGIVEDLTEPIAGDSMVVPKEVLEPEPEAAPEPVQEAAPKRSRAVKTKDAGIVETKEQPQPSAPVAARREGEPNGIIIGPNDPVRIEGDDLGQEILVTQDVYRMSFPYGSRRPSYILLYPRGTKVLKSTLQKL